MGSVGCSAVVLVVSVEEGAGWAEVSVDVVAGVVSGVAVVAAEPSSPDEQPAAIQQANASPTARATVTRLATAFS